MTGAITTTSTFDGRDIAADGALLDAVVASGYREGSDEYSVNATNPIDNQLTFDLSNIPAANITVKMYINGIRISNYATSWIINGGTAEVSYDPAKNGNYNILSTDRIQFDYSY